MVQYECFTKGCRRSETMDHRTAESILGGRVMSGWQAVHAWVDAPEGGTSAVAWLLSSDGKRVWCVFAGEILV